MSDLTEAERGQIIGLFKSGTTKTSISKTLGFPRTTVRRTIQNFLERKSLTTQPRSGRPKLLNFEHKQVLKRVVKQNNKKSAEQLKKLFNERTGLDVSTKTIRRNLHEINFFSRILTSKPLLTDWQRENRLNWCIERKDWSIEHLWSELERRIRNRSTLPKNVRELETALQEEWSQIPTMF